MEKGSLLISARFGEAVEDFVIVDRQPRSHQYELEYLSTIRQESLSSGCYCHDRSIDRSWFHNWMSFKLNPIAATHPFGIQRVFGRDAIIQGP